MVEISRLKPGMRVRIVDKWNEYTGQSSIGLMDEYLGTVMTVYAVDVTGETAYMEEGYYQEYGFYWSWNKYCIAEIINDPDERELESIDISSLMSILL